MATPLKDIPLPAQDTQLTYFRLKDNDVSKRDKPGYTEAKKQFLQPSGTAIILANRMMDGMLEDQSRGNNQDWLRIRDCAAEVMAQTLVGTDEYLDLHNRQRAGAANFALTASSASPFGPLMDFRNATQVIDPKNVTPDLLQRIVVEGAKWNQLQVDGQPNDAEAMFWAVGRLIDDVKFSPEERRNRMILYRKVFRVAEGAGVLSSGVLNKAAEIVDLLAGNLGNNLRDLSNPYGNGNESLLDQYLRKFDIVRDLITAPPIESYLKADPISAQAVALVKKDLVKPSPPAYAEHIDHW